MRPRLAELLVAVLLMPGCAEEKSGKATEKRHDEAPAAAEIPESVRLTQAAMAESGVQTWKVQPVDLEHALVLNGSVGHDEDRLVDVASNVKGRVVSIPVDLGKRVEAGTPVVWLESVELSHVWDQFVRAVADLRVSDKAYERAKVLLEGRAISTADFQSREAAFLSAKAEADTAERALRMFGEPDDEIATVRANVEAGRSATTDGKPHRMALRAPFAGRVTDRKATPGTLVEALQPLVTVADLATVWVFLHAYEKDLAAIREGLPVAIRTEAYPQERFLGRVDFIGSDVDEARRTVRVRATVRNEAEKLKPGMFVTATVDVPKPENERHEVLAVPQAAIQTLEGRTVLFVQAEPGVFVRRFVETGHTFEGYTEVLAGIAAGDLVVTEGSFVLKGEFARASLVEED